MYCKIKPLLHTFNCPVSTEDAHVAELVDAADSKSAIRKGVKVRFLSWAQIKKPLTKVRGFFICTVQAAAFAKM
jgi:hypothetical protein